MAWKEKGSKVTDLGSNRRNLSTQLQKKMKTAVEDCAGLRVNFIGPW